MTADQYLNSVMAKWRAPVGLAGPGQQVLTGLRPLLTNWASSQLASITLSGSYAKGTAVRGGTDVDIFVSLRSNTNGSLAELYDSLAQYLAASGYQVRRQNVSLGITFEGYKVDIVPGRLQPEFFTSNHSIYVRRLETWTKTNVQTHISTVGQSGLREIIILAK